MQRIELNCFQDSEGCVYVSDFKNFRVKKEKQAYQLKINNFSNQDCNLIVSLETEDTFPKDIELTVFSEKELFFKENLEKTKKNSINLNKIPHKSSKIYNFDFKIIENNDIFFDFNLILRFFCDSISNLESSQNIASNSSKVNEKSKGEILGQSEVFLQEKNPEENLANDSKQVFIPYLILLVVLIFVIMFFVNGKKKKKNYFVEKKKF